MSDLIEIQLYELSKLEGKAQAVLEGREEAKNLPLEEIWCMYIKYQGDEDKADLIRALIQEDKGLMSTERVLDRVSQDYEEWARALSREKGEMDYRSDMNYAREEGRKQAEAEIQTARQETQAAERRAQVAEQRAAELERRLREAKL